MGMWIIWPLGILRENASESERHKRLKGKRTPGCCAIFTRLCQRRVSKDELLVLHSLPLRKHGRSIETWARIISDEEFLLMYLVAHAQ
jgi:hypothetical protein